jgi:uncharacterized protein
MDGYLPLFPLKLVAFPDEPINLHIFEPRYKQLINDILETGDTFGIAVYIDSLMPFGTEVQLLDVSKLYEDGRMDIKTKALGVFEILSFDNPMAEKLYAGGKVSFKENDLKVPEAIYREFLFYLKELLRLLNHPVELVPFAVNSFSFAHKIGLTLAEEYELLTMEKESERIAYLLRHLLKVIPVMREMEAAKKKIQMNGHFKNLDPLEF